jgi:hypothetical protein
MSRNIEDFISGNREAFDDNVPSGKVWKGIEETMNGKKESKTILLSIFKWSMAAAAILFIGTMLFVKDGKKDAVVQEQVTNRQEEDINELAPEYAPQVNQFARVINLKQEELKTMAAEHPGLYRGFTADMRQLDSSYHALQQELSNSSNRDMLIEAMIQNLQLQIHVLNQQLKIIKEIKQSKKYSHEKTDPAV